MVAGLEALRAARVEAAAGREVGGVGQLAPERLALLARRHRVDQRLGVGMARALDHIARVALLDDPPEIHDRDPVAQLPRQAEVVGDEQQRELARPLELHQDVPGSVSGTETSSIETGSSQMIPGGLEHERRARSRRAGAGRPRATCGCGRGTLGREPDLVERPLHPPVMLGARRRRPPRSASATMSGHAAPRVERLVRVLEDHLDVARRSARRASPAVHRERRRRRPSRRRGDEPEHRARERGLAAARLPTMPRISPRRHSSETPSSARAARRGSRSARRGRATCISGVIPAPPPRRRARASAPRARSDRRPTGPGATSRSAGSSEQRSAA